MSALNDFTGALVEAADRIRQDYRFAAIGMPASVAAVREAEAAVGVPVSGATAGGAW
ncbi:hypothetical protein GCM10010412_088760 [Nonomuraea recticatena]|uniref:Uncharacterized protein n=1 Tax=Nonomuraea recticatena TaxID=46178 RepID=A0ABN3T818_9ACTN